MAYNNAMQPTLPRFARRLMADVSRHFFKIRKKNHEY